MPRIEHQTFGPERVVDDEGRVLYESWDPADAERFLRDLYDDHKRRALEDQAGRILGL